MNLVSLTLSIPTHRVAKSYEILSDFFRLPIHQESEVVVELKDTAELIKTIRDVVINGNFPVNYITEVSVCANYSWVLMVRWQYQSLMYGQVTISVPHVWSGDNEGLISVDKIVGPMFGDKGNVTLSLSPNICPSNCFDGLWDEIGSPNGSTSHAYMRANNSAYLLVGEICERRQCLAQSSLWKQYSVLRHNTNHLRSWRDIFSLLWRCVQGNQKVQRTCALGKVFHFRSDWNQIIVSEIWWFCWSQTKARSEWNLHEWCIKKSFWILAAGAFGF